MEKNNSLDVSMREELSKIFSEFIKEFYECIEDRESIEEKFTCIGDAFSDAFSDAMKWYKCSIALFYKDNFNLLEKERKYCITTENSKMKKNSEAKEKLINELKICRVIEVERDLKTNICWYKVENIINNNREEVWINNVVFDISPVCINFDNIVNTDNLFAKMIAFFNSSKASRRVFNELHYIQGDPNITVGFGHFAGETVNSFFKTMDDDAKDAIVNYFADELTTSNNNYFYNQILNDPIIKGKYKNIEQNEDIKRILENKDSLGELSSGEWKEFFRTFFFDYILNLPRKSTSIKSRRDGINFWIDEVEEYFSKNINNTKFFEKSTKLKNIKVGKESNTLMLKEFFPGGGKKTGFWFNDIMLNALTLEEVCRHQVRYFNENFYSAPMKWTEKILNNNKEALNSVGAEALLACLMSCKSTGIGSIKLSFYKKINDKSNAVLIISGSISKIKNEVIDGKFDTKDMYEVPNEFDFKDPYDLALLVWHSYNKFKKRVRTRQRTIWNLWLSKHYNCSNIPSFEISFRDLYDKVKGKNIENKEAL